MSHDRFLVLIGVLCALIAAVVIAWFTYVAWQSRRPTEPPETPESKSEQDADPAPLLRPAVTERHNHRGWDDTRQLVPDDYSPHIGRRLLARETNTQRLIPPAPRPPAPSKDA